MGTTNGIGSRPPGGNKPIQERSFVILVPIVHGLNDIERTDFRSPRLSQTARTNLAACLAPALSMKPLAQSSRTLASQGMIPGTFLSVGNVEASADIRFLSFLVSVIIDRLLTIVPHPFSGQPERELVNSVLFAFKMSQILVSFFLR